MKLQSYLSRIIWIAIAPLLVLATVFAVNDLREQREGTARDARDLARNIAGVVDRQLALRIAAMQMLAADEHLGVPERAGEVYRDAQNFERIFDTHLLLADPAGQMLWNTRVPLGAPLPQVPRSTGHSAVEHAITQGKPSVSDGVFGPLANRRLFAIVVPVMRDGKPRFLMVATAEDRYFEQLLGTFTLPKGWVVTLYDGTGARVAAAGTADPAGAGDIEQATSDLGNARWKVAVDYPPLMQTRDARASAVSLVLLLVVSTLTAVLGARFASRKLERSLATLAQPAVPGGPVPRDDIAEVRDIAEQLAALERARNDSEARLVATFEQATVGIAHVGVDGRWLRVNPALAAMLGRPAAELAGLDSVASTHPDDRARDVALVDRVLAGEADSYAVEKRFVAGDGRTVWANVRVALVRAADRTPDYFIAVAEDITARKQTEDALRSTTAKLQATLDSMSDALASFDRDGHLVEANAAFLRMNGFASIAECLGAGGMEVRTVDGALVPREERPVWRALRGEAVTGTELRITRPDTGRSWVASFSAAPILDAGNTITGAVMTAQDVTARRLVEDALRASEERLRLLVEHAPAAIAIFDRQMRYLAVSQRWRDDYALGDRDLVGVCQYDVFPEIGEGWRDIHRRALAGETLAADEDAFVRASGNTQWLRWEVRPWRMDDGEIGGIVIFSEDITAAKQADLALLESERRFRDIVEATADWVWETDAQWRYTYVSDSVEAALGHPPATVVGRTPFDFMPAVEAARVRAVLVAAFEQGLPVRNLDHLNVHRNGDLRSTQTSAMPVLDAEGRCIGYRGLGHDVTERRRAEVALRDSEARYRELFEANPHPMWVYDPATLRFLAVNDAAVIQYGYSREEFLALTIADLRPPDDTPRLQRAVAEQKDNAEPGLWRHRRKDGSRLWVEITSHRLRFDARNAVVVLASDVTRRLEAEAQLRKLSMAMEQSPEAVIITDLDWNVEYVNEAFEATTGYGRSEMLGRSIMVLKSPAAGSEAEEDLIRALAAGQPWKGEFVNRRRDGTDYIASAVVAPIREADGRITHYVSVQEDITARKHLEEELAHHRLHLAELVELRTSELSVATRAANAASAAKSAFLTNMSHEIRTPMNAVLGFAYLLKRSGVTPQQQDWIDKLAAAGEHLLLIINDILDLSKIESGKLVLEQVDFPLQTVVDNVRSLILEQARRKDIAVAVDCAAAPLWLRGDPTRLRQALLNYAGNAIKFTAAGRIDLRARVVREEAQRLLVRFEVVDTGSGIPEASLPNLFEAFRQGDDSTTRKHGGTGLGLAITRRLAEAMGGEVGVASRVGEGSTFWFTAWVERGSAPRPAAAPKAADPEAALRERHPGARILLVDDDPINQEVALILLTDAGLAVDVANDGEEAVAALSPTHRLVLMDLQMPKMDGIEATRAMRALPGRGTVPILAMTANAFEDDRRRCIDAGMNDFLAKPFDPADLYATVLRWLDAG
ncbi:MAG: PAS domain S-box protein [Burkholderiales bacterium]